MSPTATDIVGWAVVNLGVVLPIETLYEMSPGDSLYLSLMKAWKDREEREDRRVALLCCVIANSQGNKTKPEDFMPKKVKTTEDLESEIKANFQAYNERVNAKK